MIWVLAACIACTLLVPPLVALVEGLSIREGPRGVGFWAFARSVAGTCHVRWGRGRSPIIRFQLPEGEGRARAVRAPGRGFSVEVRAYQRRVFGFAARICLPRAPAARWRSPGLEPLELYAEETEHLLDASLETTDERLLRWLLRHAETRRVLDGLVEASRARAVEVVLAGSVIIIRGLPPKGMPAADAVETLGPALVEALRRLSADLHDLAEALEEAGDEALVTTPCRGCGAPVDDDPWRCPGCALHLHRGCRELLGGCAEHTCEQAPDALPSVRPPTADDDAMELPEAPATP